jgi:hypothetical protein
MTPSPFRSVVSLLFGFLLFLALSTSTLVIAQRVTPESWWIVPGSNPPQETGRQLWLATLITLPAGFVAGLMTARMAGSHALLHGAGLALAAVPLTLVPLLVQELGSHELLALVLRLSLTIAGVLSGARLSGSIEQSRTAT